MLSSEKETTNAPGSGDNMLSAPVSAFAIFTGIEATYGALRGFIE